MLLSFLFFIGIIFHLIQLLVRFFQLYLMIHLVHLLKVLLVLLNRTFITSCAAAVDRVYVRIELADVGSLAADIIPVVFYVL